MNSFGPRLMSAFVILSLVTSSLSLAEEPAQTLDVEPIAKKSQDSKQTEDWHTTFKRHRWIGLGATSLVALNLGLGIGMASHRENQGPLNNDTNTTVRAIHLLSSLSLVGLGMYQFFDGRTLRGSKESISKHGHWAYTYLGMLLVTGTLGILSSHVFVNQASARAGLSHAHIGAGVATVALQWAALINIPFGFE